jgi:hypothetical protein
MFDLKKAEKECKLSKNEIERIKKLLGGNFLTID